MLKKVFLVRPRGFCAGVARAIKILDFVVAKYPPPIYVKNIIVHNETVAKRFKAKDVVFVNDINEVPDGSVLVYSAHGVHPNIKLIADKKSLIQIDATCPLVTKVHSAAKMFYNQGYKIIIIGHKNHPEVIGINGEANDLAYIIENEKGAESFIKKNKSFIDNKIAYVSQTTFNMFLIKNIIEKLKIAFPFIETIPSSSICFATFNRQKALSNLLTKEGDIDLALIIGDKRSSNANRLVDIALANNVETFLIQNESELTIEIVSNKYNIAITSAASTPESCFDKCILKLKEMITPLQIEKGKGVKKEMSFSIPRL